MNAAVLISELYGRMKAEGRMLFLNGVMLDSISVTEPDLIKLYMKVCHGMFWEQPFRWEWRTFDNGTENYYQRLERFFELSHLYKKNLIIKSGTYRFHATEDVEQDWKARFETTDAGIEKHLAEYAVCFFLMFYNRHFDCLYHTHPTELFDIYTSEAYFDIWDAEIGEPLGARVEHSPHIQIREFENAFVYLNNTLKPVQLSHRKLVGKFRSQPPLPELQPLSGKIVFKANANKIVFKAKASVKDVADEMKSWIKSVIGWRR